MRTRGTMKMMRTGGSIAHCWSAAPHALHLLLAPMRPACLAGSPDRPEPSLTLQLYEGRFHSPLSLHCVREPYSASSGHAVLMPMCPQWP